MRTDRRKTPSLSRSSAREGAISPPPAPWTPRERSASSRRRSPDPQVSILQPEGPGSRSGRYSRTDSRAPARRALGDPGFAQTCGALPPSQPCSDSQRAAKGTTATALRFPARRHPWERPSSAHTGAGQPQAQGSVLFIEPKPGTTCPSIVCRNSFAFTCSFLEQFETLANLQGSQVHHVEAIPFSVWYHLAPDAFCDSRETVPV